MNRYISQITIVFSVVFSTVSLGDTATEINKINLDDDYAFNTSCSYRVSFKDTGYVSQVHTVSKEKLFFETVIVDPTKKDDIDFEDRKKMMNKYIINANEKSIAKGDIVYDAFFEERNVDLTGYELIELICIPNQ